MSVRQASTAPHTSSHQIERLRQASDAKPQLRNKGGGLCFEATSNRTICFGICAAVLPVEVLPGPASHGRVWNLICLEWEHLQESVHAGAG